MKPYIFTVQVRRRKPQFLLVMVDVDDGTENMVEFVKLAFGPEASVQVIGDLTTLTREQTTYCNVYEIPKGILKAFQTVP